MTKPFTRESAADLSAKEGYIGAIDANGNVVLGAAATDDLIGIIVEGGRASGDACAIADSGTEHVKIGGTVNEGDFLTSDSAGRAVATTTANQKIVGMALSAGVINDEIPVRLGIAGTPV
jgi:hypothetical protein